MVMGMVNKAHPDEGPLPLSPKKVYSVNSLGYYMPVARQVAFMPDVVHPPSFAGFVPE